MSKQKYWEALVLCAMEEANFFGGEYKANALSADNIVRQLAEWEVLETRVEVSRILSQMKLKFFDKVESEYASARYIPHRALTTAVLGGYSDLFDKMATDNDFGEIWSSFRLFGRSWLLESIENVGSIESIAIETSPGNEEQVDDVWEPLPLDYDAEEASMAIEAVAAAADVVEGDNGFSATHPAERDTIVHSLRSAAALMRVRGEYTKIYFKHSVIEPLKRASLRLGKGASSKAIEAAIKGIQKWISENVFDLLSKL